MSVLLIYRPKIVESLLTCQRLYNKLLSYGEEYPVDFEAIASKAFVNSSTLVSNLPPALRLHALNLTRTLAPYYYPHLWNHAIVSMLLVPVVYVISQMNYFKKDNLSLGKSIIGLVVIFSILIVWMLFPFHVFVYILCWIGIDDDGSFLLQLSGKN